VAVLTAAGAVQWKRARSVATAMVAIGFAMVLSGQVRCCWSDVAFPATPGTLAKDAYRLSTE
jgi:hypothetical protein